MSHLSCPHADARCLINTQAERHWSATEPPTMPFASTAMTAQSVICASRSSAFAFRSRAAAALPLPSVSGRAGVIRHFRIAGAALLPWPAAAFRCPPACGIHCVAAAKQLCDGRLRAAPSAACWRWRLRQLALLFWKGLVSTSYLHPMLSSPPPPPMQPQRRLTPALCQS
jgi:hypothetical protein